jgi:hypothetical protein
MRRPSTCTYPHTNNTVFCDGDAYANNTALCDGDAYANNTALCDGDAYANNDRTAPETGRCVASGGNR